MTARVIRKAAAVVVAAAALVVAALVFGLSGHSSTPMAGPCTLTKVAAATSDIPVLDRPGGIRQRLSQGVCVVTY